jgi:hypothetical protein
VTNVRKGKTKSFAVKLGQGLLKELSGGQAVGVSSGPRVPIPFVEFVIQILKKAAKLASEAEARRREAWAGAL